VRIAQPFLCASIRRPLQLLDAELLILACMVNARFKISISVSAAFAVFAVASGAMNVGAGDAARSPRVPQVGRHVLFA
jgi:hypothetical protein